LSAWTDAEQKKKKEGREEEKRKECALAVGRSVLVLRDSQNGYSKNPDGAHKRIPRRKRKKRRGKKKKQYRLGARYFLAFLFNAMCIRSVGGRREKRGGERFYCGLLSGRLFLSEFGGAIERERRKKGGRGEERRGDTLPLSRTASDCRPTL